MSDNIVVFTSGRKLYRAENIKAVYKAYGGPKIFRRNSPTKRDIENADVIVCDEFPWEACWKNSVMITHGIPLTKTYGLDMPKSWVIPNSVKYIIAPSKAAVPIMARQGGVPEDMVLPLGMPRFDEYIGKQIGDGNTILASKRTYLYAPTFRDKAKGEGSLPDIDLDYIDSRLEDNELFVVKAHMRTKDAIPIKEYNHVLIIDNDLPSAPFLIDCSVLITDYSSIVFDGHALRKPIVLFEKDAERYLEKRGMYLDYPYGYASRHCRREDDLVDMCREATHRNHIDEVCREMAVSACDGHSTERVIELITKA